MSEVMTIVNPVAKNADSVTLPPGLLSWSVFNDTV
jgi:hypothetical protein